MKQANYLIPLDQNRFLEEVNDNIFRKRDYFRYSGLVPAPLILHMNKGEGRTSILNYLAVSYSRSDIIGFTGGIDDFLDLSVGGSSLRDVKKTLSDIRSFAVYDNVYRGVIGLDITRLAECEGENQLDEFIEASREICLNACVVFFLPSEETKNTRRLEERLMAKIGRIKSIPFEPYSTGSLAAAVIIRLEKINAYVIRSTASRDISVYIENVIREQGITTLKDAVALADGAAEYADYSGARPVMTQESFVAYLEKKNTKGGHYNVKK